MNRPRVALVVLVALAAAVTVLGRQSEQSSPTPSIHNRGARGAGVLATWLRESGVEVIELDAPLTAPIDPRVKTLVLAAPMADEVSADEQAQLRAFVEAGGTLVYLDPRGKTQPALQNWLDFHAGPLPAIERELGFEDVSGTTVEVRFPGGPLADVRQLRVAAEQMLDVKKPGAVPVTTDGALWWIPVGRGEVWLGAGQDLIENARLELLDNAKWWAAVAGRGPIAFDEYHHVPHARGLPLNVTATLLQLLFLAGLFLWARAPRLGPPREEPPHQHRSSLDYVRAMATLTANANVEHALVDALRHEFRRRLDESQGISVKLGWAEAARELEKRTGQPQAALIAAEHDVALLSVSRVLAEAERALRA